MVLLELLGVLVGIVLAPLVFLGSLVRGARLFHPDGVVCRAEIVPIATDGPAGALAGRLAGDALVRLSGGVFRGPGEPRDILGAALRFGPPGLPLAGDQDLLLATFRTFRSLPSTLGEVEPHDFLANTYTSVASYATDGLARVRVRLVPVPGTVDEGATGTRGARLDAAIAADRAGFVLELAPHGAPWQKLAHVHLRARLPVDDRALRFDPRRAGRGLRPVGWFRGLRGVAYPVSQAARKLRGG